MLRCRKFWLIVVTPIMPVLFVVGVFVWAHATQVADWERWITAQIAKAGYADQIELADLEYEEYYVGTTESDSGYRSWGCELHWRAVVKSKRTGERIGLFGPRYGELGRMVGGSLVTTFPGPVEE